VTVTDSVTATGNKGFSVTINPPLSITAPASLPAGMVGAAYPATQITATGGTGAYTWSATGLPPGLGIAPATGIISGIPTSSVGSPFSVTVTVTDSVTATSNKGYSLTINPALAITTTSPLPPWTVGVAYSQTLAATGGTPPYGNWQVTAGALPPGLLLGAATGQISGTPTAAGPYNFTVQVTDSAAQTATKIFDLTINPAPSITMASLPSPWAVNVAYPPTSLTATGGTGALTWSLAPGSAPLPTGLTISAAGVISGTPTSTGTFNFTTRVTDVLGAWGDKPFSIIVTAALTIITPAVTSPWTAGIPYSQSLAASGGLTPYTWTQIAGALPGGLTLTGNVISGTPTATGAFNFTVQVTDSTTPTPQTASKIFDLTINPAPIITTASLPSPWTQGVVYPNTTLTATGGTGAYSWSATGLPPGLSIAPATGVMTGTPTTSVGSPFSVTVTVTDSVTATGNKPFTITINPPLSITTASLPSPWTQGVAYPSTTMAATGGTGTLAWSLAAGSGPLPPGLTLVGNTLSGTPSAAGTYNFTVRATDTVGATADKPFSVTINPPLAIATTSPLPSGTVGVAYAATLQATGGISPYTWSAAGLPAWLALNSTTGALSGTPTTQGSFTFFVTVTDSATPTQQTVTRQFTLNIAAGLVVVTSSLPNGTVGVLYSQTLIAAGGTAPYGWAVTFGSLPPGLNLVTGQITGTPTSAGTFSFTVRVTDSAAATATSALSITVATALSVTTSSLANGSVGVAYSQSLTVTGGTSPYNWSATGLPGWLTLNPSTGVLSGTPASPGTYNFTVAVRDSGGVVATKALSITVISALAITTSSPLPDGTVGRPYSLILAVAGGTPPYANWSLSGGALPPGLSLNSATGVISGTPTTAGGYSFMLRVTDGAGSSAEKLVTLPINAALTITSPAQLPAGAVGAAYSQTLTATGGSAPYTWSVTSGQPPAGLTLNGQTGALTGTPTAAGTSSFTVQVADSAGQKATQAVSLTISGGFSITSESPLPSGSVGVAYSYALAAAGGAPPYTEWRVISGIVPAGLTLDSSIGRIYGTPPTAGTLSFTVQVRDSVGNTASKTFSLTVGAAPLAITTASPLPSGLLGRAYSQTLAATGGSAPYSWALTGGSLPADLSLEADAGRLSGAPSAVGSYSFTIEVTDSARRTASKAFTLVIDPPPLTAVQITGLADTAEPAQQPSVQLILAAPYPLEITGQLTLKFEPDAVNPSDDPAIQFSTGGRTASFRIPANTTQAVFTAPSLALQTGTVAGAITLGATFKAEGQNITPTPDPSRVTRLLRSAPVIRSVEVTKSGSSFEIIVRGFSNPRQVTQATFRFTAASGANLQTLELTLPMTALSDQWFLGQESQQFGGQFTLRQAFTVQGDIRAISAVSVVLSNAVGASQPSSTPF